MNSTRTHTGGTADATLARPQPHPGGEWRTVFEPISASAPAPRGAAGA